MPGLGFLHTGLPRSDVSLGMLKYTPGQVGSGRLRTQVGYTNRRDYYVADVTPALQSLNGTLKLSSTMNASLDRSAAHRSFSEVAASQRSESVSHSHLAPPTDQLLESLHYRAQHNLTPESFFFDSTHVGSGGQLVEDRMAVLRSKSSLSVRSHRPPPLPNHTLMSEQLRAARASTSSRLGQSPSPCPGLAGFVPPPTTEDTSVRNMALLDGSEGFVNRHLSDTPTVSSFRCNSSSAVHSTHVSVRTEGAAERRAAQAAAQMKYFTTRNVARDDEASTSTMPVLEDVPRPKLRMELTDFHPTWYVTQPPPQAGSYASERQRLNPNDIHLGRGLFVQEEKAARFLLQDLRAQRRRDAEERVIQACVTRDLSLPIKKENKIEHDHKAAIAAWKIKQADFALALRKQAEMDERSESSLRRNQQHAEH